MNIDKQQIGIRFHKAASTYDSQAVIQLRVAERLLALLETSGCRNPKNVLEIGSCTGLLTERIADRFPSITSLCVNDLVPQFQQRISNKLEGKSAQFHFLPGDIEQIGIPGSFDLVISSSTFHWFHNLERFFEKISHHIDQGGILAFAMYGPENLQEIKQLTGIGLDYPDLVELRQLVSRHFQVLCCDQTHETFTFASPQLLLNHLRETGVNSLTRKSWTRTQLKKFTEDYIRSFSTTDKTVRLTYHPMYCIAARA